MKRHLLWAVPLVAAIWSFDTDRFLPLYAISIAALIAIVAHDRRHELRRACFGGKRTPQWLLRALVSMLILLLLWQVRAQIPGVARYIEKAADSFQQSNQQPRSVAMPDHVAEELVTAIHTLLDRENRFRLSLFLATFPLAIAWLFERGRHKRARKTAALCPACLLPSFQELPIHGSPSDTFHCPTVLEGYPDMLAGEQCDFQNTQSLRPLPKLSFAVTGGFTEELHAGLVMGFAALLEEAYGIPLAGAVNSQWHWYAQNVFDPPGPPEPGFSRYDSDLARFDVPFHEVSGRPIVFRFRDCDRFGRSEGLATIVDMNHHVATGQQAQNLCGLLLFVDATDSGPALESFADSVNHLRQHLGRRINLPVAICVSRLELALLRGGGNCAAVEESLREILEIREQSPDGGVCVHRLSRYTKRLCSGLESFTCGITQAVEQRCSGPIAYFPMPFLLSPSLGKYCGDGFEFAFATTLPLLFSPFLWLLHVTGYPVLEAVVKRKEVFAPTYDFCPSAEVGDAALKDVVSPRDRVPNVFSAPLAEHPAIGSDPSVAAVIGLVVSMSKSRQRSTQQGRTPSPSPCERFWQAMDVLVEKGQSRAQEIHGDSGESSVEGLLFAYASGIGHSGEVVDLLSLLRAEGLPGNEDIRKIAEQQLATLRSDLRARILRALTSPFCRSRCSWAGAGHVIDSVEMEARDFFGSRDLLNSVKDQIEREVGERVRRQLAGIGDTTLTVSQLAQIWAANSSGCSDAGQLFVGATPMRQCLEEVSARFAREVAQLPQDVERLLVLISDGISTDGCPSPVLQRLKSDGVVVACCAIADHDVVEEKHLYGSPQESWPPRVRSMWEHASTLPEDLMIGELLEQRGWTVEENARLFLQGNQSRAFEELLSLMFSRSLF